MRWVRGRWFTTKRRGCFAVTKPETNCNGCILCSLTVCIVVVGSRRIWQRCNRNTYVYAITVYYFCNFGFIVYYKTVTNSRTYFNRKIYKTNYHVDFLNWRRVDSMPFFCWHWWYWTWFTAGTVNRYVLLIISYSYFVAFYPQQRKTQRLRALHNTYV